MNEPSIFVGIDIAKKTLEIACLELSLPSELSNDQAGVKSLVKTLKKHRSKVLVVCEATGGLESLLVDALQENDLAISVLNPRQARDFARACGQLAKTDKIDAAILAEFARRMEPAPKAKTDPKVRLLAAWAARREDVVQMHTAELNRLKQSSERFVVKHLKLSIKRLDGAIKALDRQMVALVNSDPLLKEKRRLLCAVQGVGPVAAHTLLATVPELGSLKPTEVAHLLGVAPLNCDSGLFRGQRRIYGGRRFARRVLYMAAITAAHHNKVLAPFYQRLIQRGKLKKVALVAVMRKLIIYLNRVLKPSLPGAQSSQAQP